MIVVVIDLFKIKKMSKQVSKKNLEKLKLYLQKHDIKSNSKPGKKSGTKPRTS